MDATATAFSAEKTRQPLTLKRSPIGWCDFSGNFLNFVFRGRKGDCEVGPECEHCYALRIIDRFQLVAEHTEQNYSKLSRLARWDADAEITKVRTGATEPFRRGKYSRPLIFVVDMGDLFHVNVDDKFIFKFLEIVAQKGNCDFLVLTKREKRMRSVMRDFYGVANPIVVPNLWLGVTAGVQIAWDKRVPVLMDTPAAVRFVSMEPLLQPIDIHPHQPLPDWLIVGAESGPGRREFRLEWAEQIHRQVRDSDQAVAFFGKQDSALAPGRPLLIEGVTVKEFPR